MKKGNNKILVFDLDGTLIDKEEKFSIELSNSLRNNSDIKILATGRNKCSIDNCNVLAKVLKSFNPNIVCYNGNAIYNFETKSFSVINSFSILRNDLIQFGLHYIIDIGGNIYASSNIARLKFCYINRLPRASVEIGIPFCKVYLDVLLIQCFDNKLLELTLSTTDVEVNKNKNFSIFYPLNTGKENGVSYLIKSLMLEGNIVSFGNGINDISLLSWSTTGVAVKDSCQPLKNVADEILSFELYKFINNL